MMIISDFPMITVYRNSTIEFDIMTISHDVIVRWHDYPWLISRSSGGSRGAAGTSTAAAQHAPWTSAIQRPMWEKCGERTHDHHMIITWSSHDHHMIITSQVLTILSGNCDMMRHDATWCDMMRHCSVPDLGFLCWGCEAVFMCHQQMVPVLIWMSWRMISERMCETTVEKNASRFHLGDVSSSSWWLIAKVCGAGGLLHGSHRWLVPRCRIRV